MGIERELDLHLTRRQLFGLTARGIGIGGARRRCSRRSSSRLARAPGRRAIPKTGGLDRAPALRAEGQARHLPAPVRRAVAARDVRLQAEPREVPGHADPRLGAPGPARRPDDGAVVPAGGEVDVRLRAARPGGDVGQRAAAAHREDRRRHHRHQDDEHGRDQSRPGDHVHPDRIPAAGPAEHGRVAQLRARQRESEPAGVRRAAVAGARDHDRSAAVLAAVGQRVPAVELSGRPVPRPAARRCSTSTILPGVTRTTRRADARCGRRS